MHPGANLGPWLTRWKFKKTVDGKTLVVVAEVKKSECWLATAYYEDP